MRGVGTGHRGAGIRGMEPVAGRGEWVELGGPGDLNSIRLDRARAASGSDALEQAPAAEDSCFGVACVFRQEVDIPDSIEGFHLLR